MKRKGKIIFILCLIFSVISIGVSCYAHSGRTDSNGGHRDNKNKSGLGSYHYHCGGYPAHLHENGICPYSASSSETTKSTTSTSTGTSVKTIEVTGIEIITIVDEMEKGDTKYLFTSITPDNATSKEVVWKSSDESIATVDSNGKVTAIKPGKVNITAQTSNGKTDTVEVNVIEESVNTNTIATTKIQKSNTINESNNEEDDFSLVVVIITIGILGVCGYLIYKENKK